MNTSTMRSTVNGPMLAESRIRRTPGARKRGSISRAFSHKRLDRCLQRFARKPQLFARDALGLCAVLDDRGLDLEITDPSAWRTAAVSTRVRVESQFSAEIDSVRIMGREEELRLALRIEFASLRLKRALSQHGLTLEALAETSAPSPVVTRRRQEWHALRLEMVERNLYLVLINVERYRHTSADRADLIQAAAAGLFRAVDGFDWRRGVLFRTYAVYWLDEGFRSHLYNFNSTIRVPIYLQKSIKHVNAAIQRLGDPHASVEEIARESGLRENTILSARRAVRSTRSLDVQLDDASDMLGLEPAMHEDEHAFGNALDGVSVEAGLESALSRLTDRERRVVRMRFGIGYEREHVYSEMATELGVSLERVRQILVRAMAKMRTPRLLKVLESMLT